MKGLNSETMILSLLLFASCTFCFTLVMFYVLYRSQEEGVAVVTANLKHPDKLINQCLLINYLCSICEVSM